MSGLIYRRLWQRDAWRALGGTQWTRHTFRPVWNESFGRLTPPTAGSRQIPPLSRRNGRPRRRGRDIRRRLGGRDSNVATERDNLNNGISRKSYPASIRAGASCHRDQRWALNADLPVTGANLGLGDLARPRCVPHFARVLDGAARTICTIRRSTRITPADFFVGV